MRAVIPLAGPDFVGSYGVKPMVEVEGEPLVRRAITSRAWWRSGRLRSEDLIFVLRERPEATPVRAALAAWFPGCAFVEVGRATGGALLSALAGAALAPADERPLLIDLVDILFDMDDAKLDLLADRAVGAVAPWFESDSSAYSYLEIGGDGDVIRAREKVVISRHASAGAYFFANLASFVGAAGYALQHSATLAHNGNQFVCPALNGVIAAGGARVVPIQVENVRAISKFFH